MWGLGVEMEFPEQAYFRGLGLAGSGVKCVSTGQGTRGGSGLAGPAPGRALCCWGLGNTLHVLSTVPPVSSVHVPSGIGRSVTPLFVGCSGLPCTEHMPGPWISA